MAAKPSKQDKNPFACRTGTLPEHIVGRKKGFKKLGDALWTIRPDKFEKDGRMKRPPISPIVFSGPRGTGKTLMLDWMEDRAKEMGIYVARVNNFQDLAEGTALRRLLDAVAGGAYKVLLKLLKSFGLAVEQVGEEEMTPSATSYAYKDALKAKLRQGPVLLLMEDVHLYEVGVLTSWMHAAQDFASSQYPCVIVFAGTPELDHSISETQAGFMARAPSIDINLLKTEDSKKALSKPFADRDIEVEPQALEMMWAMTGNHPYFVQLVGSEIWKALPSDGKKKVDVALVEQAREGINSKRRDFFRAIYDELKDLEIASYALQIGEKIEESGPMRRHIEYFLEDKNSELGEDAARKIAFRLEHLGFVWHEYGESDMLLGFPAFLPYLREKEQAAAEEMNKPAGA